MKTRTDTEIITEIYRTVENPDHWSSALRAIVEKVGGDKAIVFSAHMDKAKGGLWALHEIDQRAIDVYQNRFANSDPRHRVGGAKGVFDGAGTSCGPHARSAARHRCLPPAELLGAPCQDILGCRMAVTPIYQRTRAENTS